MNKILLTNYYSPMHNESTRLFTVVKIWLRQLLFGEGFSNDLWYHKNIPEHARVSRLFSVVDALLHL